MDFADLLDMDELDTVLRRTFLLAPQDVERLAKTIIITRISEDEDEDSYGIVADFMESQEPRYRSYIVRDLRLRKSEKEEGDVYSGRIIGHYGEAMPIWAFLEVVTFGTYLGACPGRIQVGGAGLHYAAHGRKLRSSYLLVARLALQHRQERRGALQLPG